jgi:predicted GNAT family N-acyltransferase
MESISIIDKLNSEQIEQLYHLYKQTWWANDRTMDEILIMLETSLSFGFIENETNNLIAYARVLTDKFRYAFIFDVIVDEKFRNKGLGKKLIEVIFEHPELKNIKRFELTCKSVMIPFYEKFGFKEDYGDDVKAMRCKVES